MNKSMKAKYPDMVIGIGGTGKKLVKNLMMTEWFIDDVVREYNEDNTGNFNGTAIRIIDSDKREASSDEDDIEYIKNTIDVRLGDGSANRVFKLDNCFIDISTNSSLDLKDPDRINKIKNNEKYGAKIWWIDDNKNGLKDAAVKIDPDFEKATFSKGVNRRRFLSKALLYNYLSEEYSSLLLADEGRHIAIIVALGGGTGSGTFLDMAKFLKRNTPNCSISLFATLPTIEEPFNERANAYAAISELELTDVFDQIILLPIDPSGYKGSDVTSPELSEYSEVFSYIFTAAYERVSVDDHSFSTQPQYKKFIVASGYITRYSAKALLNKADQVNDATSTFFEYCKHESELRHKINTLFKDLGLVHDAEDDVDTLQAKMFTDFKSVFCDGSISEILYSFEYAKVMCAIRDEVENKEQELGDINKLKIEDMKAIILDVKNDINGAVERELLDYAESWLNNIKMFKSQLSNIADIPDARLKTAAKKIVVGSQLGGALEVELEDKHDSNRKKAIELTDEIKKFDSKLHTTYIVEKIKNYLKLCENKYIDLIESDDIQKKDDWKTYVSSHLQDIKIDVAPELYVDLDHASEYYRLQASEKYYSTPKKIFGIKHGVRNKKKAKVAQKRITDIVNRFKVLSEESEHQYILFTQNILKHIPESVEIDIEQTFADLDKIKGQKEIDNAELVKKCRLIHEILSLKELSNKVHKLNEKYKDEFSKLGSDGASDYGKFIHIVNPEDSDALLMANEESDLSILSQSSDGISLKDAVTKQFNDRYLHSMTAENHSGVIFDTSAEVAGTERKVKYDAFKISTFSLDTTLIPTENEKRIINRYIQRGSEVPTVIQQTLKLAAKWDIARVVMVMYAPFDLLKNASYYATAYDSIRESKGMRGLISHHTEKLEDGYICIRPKILNGSEIAELVHSMKDNNERKQKLEDIYDYYNINEILESSHEICER